MQTLPPSQLVESLNWRYAVKAFDAAQKIPADVWSALVTSLTLSPSSYGLQPYRFIVVNDPAVRAQLVPHSWGQRQIVDASHLVIFAARTTMAEADVDRLISRVSQVRGVPAEALKGYRDLMVGDLVTGPRAGVAGHWAARQAYLALGDLLTSAALLGVDACPIEGFVPAEYDKLIKLEGSGYTAVVVAALGYRSADDKYAHLPKVRFETSDLVRTI